MRKWPIILALLTACACHAQTFRRNFEYPSVSGAQQVGAIADGTIVGVDFADADLGDISVLTGVFTLDDDVVAPAEMADADHGAFTYVTGVATLDADSVALSNIADGTAAGDILYYTGSAWAILDVNDPNNTLTISDSNLPSWQASIPITPGGSVGPGGGNSKLKFTTNNLIAMLDTIGLTIGGETATLNTPFTVIAGSGNDLFLEYIADANEDNADRWRWIYPDSGTYVTLQSYSTGAWVDKDWLGLSGTDADADTSGQLSVDTDGANEPNDVVLRTPDTGGDTQYALAQAHKQITIAINDPDGIKVWAGRVNPSQPAWFNTTGMTFTIVEIYAVADVDNYDFNLFESASATDMSDDNDTLIDLLECEADGTEAFTDTETTISHAAIEHDHAIIFEHSDTDAGALIITVKGYFNADVD